MRKIIRDWAGTAKQLKAVLSLRENGDRLEYLRKQIQAENISYSEIAELQSLVDYIDKDDVELLEWAGVKEN